MGKTYGGYAGWVGLDACDAGFLGFADDFWSDGLVEVEGHEVVDVWLDGLQSVAVLEALFDSSDWRDQIWLEEKFRTALTCDRYRRRRRLKVENCEQN